MIAIGAANTSGIFTVIGVGLGSAGALASQLITTRATGRQARQERLASVRQEQRKQFSSSLRSRNRLSG